MNWYEISIYQDLSSFDKENAGKPHLGPDFLFCFCFEVSPLLDNRYCLKLQSWKYQGKLTIQTVCYYYVMYAFQSESTLYSCLNIKELLARNKRDIWSLSDSNGIRTHNHLVGKRTLNQLGKPAKWSSCVVSTYWYGAFDCMVLSCHVRVSEWIYSRTDESTLSLY